MLLKVAINGRRMLAEHPAIPITPSQQAHQAAIAIAAGAGAIHVHPRDSMGWESLADIDVAATLDSIRAACPGIPIGVSTGAWIVPETGRRFALIKQWKVLPDQQTENARGLCDCRRAFASPTCQTLKQQLSFRAGR